ncbi:hypothetical protein [Azospirillum sp. A39]|uniref:hypothetical protein n=1 Tax=Azospirillum sp. A39 TaxID=3462279 RepID=UPI00404574F9
MTADAAPDDVRRPAILIPDATPLSLLGMVRGLDWLFAPGAELWITDMVWDEVLREPDEGKDRRVAQRSETATWLDANRHRIRRIGTEIGRRYQAEVDAHARALELWRRAGHPEDLRPEPPERRGRGDASVLPAVKMANETLALGTSVLALADDRDLRAALLVTMAREPAASVTLMGTQTFLAWIHEDFGVEDARHAWAAIEIATGGRAPDAADPDPLHIRTPE